MGKTASTAKQARDTPRTEKTKAAQVTQTNIEPVRSFCAHVINLCYEVESAGGLTHLKTLTSIASYIRKEAEIVQSLYGGHPIKPDKLPPPTDFNPQKKR